MRNEFVILVADRNRHVREFLRREFAAEGYRVEVARDGREVLMKLCREPIPDLLVLDLEIPDADGLDILDRLELRDPPLPVVIHTFLTDLAEYSGRLRMQRSVAELVEKSENTDRLKAAVHEALKKYYPYRFSSASGKTGDAAENSHGR